MATKPKIQKHLFMRRLSRPHAYVARRIETEYWHHRSAWMEAILKDIVSWFTSILGKRYLVRLITAQSDAGFEVYATNLLTDGDVVWVPKTDPSAIAVVENLGGIPVPYHNEKKFPVQAPRMVLLETVTQHGTQVDVQTIAASIRTQHPKTLIIVDGRDSLGADAIDWKHIDADGFIFAPERALGGIPGIAILAFTKALLDQVRTVRPSQTEVPYAFDLLRYEKAWEKITTPYSPDISASLALGATLSLLEKNGGLAAHIARTKTMRTHVRTILSQYGLRPVATPHGTHSFTVCTVEKTGLSAATLVKRLAARGVSIELSSDASSVICSHHGLHQGDDLAALIHALAHVTKKKPTPVPEVAPLETPPLWDLRAQEAFSIAPQEFIDMAVREAGKAYGHTSALPSLFAKSAQQVFAQPLDYDVYGCHRDRTVGFIGAGNTVRETVARLQKFGVVHLMVYSPSLAARVAAGDTGNADDHHDPLYWTTRGVTIAPDATTIYLQAHTVILLPTLYTPHAQTLLKKPARYLNEKSINEKLLARIRDHGRMDLLINACAREELIDRPALARHLKEGWLTYIADELPPASDPVLRTGLGLFTGHIGGSSKKTRQQIATNTSLILENVVRHLSGKDRTLHETNGNYHLNLTNRHLLPKTPPPIPVQKTVRILLTDSFDVERFNLGALESSLGIHIDVRDVSARPMSERSLLDDVRDFDPHIIMIRTRTRITERVARLLVTQKSCSYIIRPGVGIDNVYPGIKTLSAAGIRVINEPHGNSFSVGEMTTHFVLNGRQKVLLAPGPTQYVPEVFQVMSEYTAPHDPSFTRIYKETQKMLSEWMDLRGTLPLLFSSPSTGLMEAAIQGLTPHGAAGLVVSHGKFGNRFADIAKGRHRHIDIMETPDASWGSCHTPASISTQLKEKSARGESYDFLCIQQNETSSGVSYTHTSLKQIVNAARAHNPRIICIVDGVSGTGAHDVVYGKLDIDMLVVGSQKAFGVSSGVTYTTLSPRALSRMAELAGYEDGFEKLKKTRTKEGIVRAYEKKQRIYYYSLLRAALDPHMTCRIPSIFHVLSTHASLKKLAREGSRAAILKRHKSLTTYTRNFVKDMGWETLSSEPFISYSVTPVLVPTDADAPRVRRILEREYGFFAAESQCEYWKPRLVRIGHVGYVYHRDLVRCLRALRLAVYWEA